MATGIVSIAAWDFQLAILALALFALNLAAFAVLVVLTVLRGIRHPRAFVADMTDHQAGPRQWPGPVFSAPSSCS